RPDARPRGARPPRPLHPFALRRTGKGGRMTTQLTCRCGQVRLEVTGAPMVSAECCCNSCRRAAARFEQLPGAQPVLGPHGTVRYELYRKDRVRFVSGQEQMRAFRLKPNSPTRRVVAGCCNTPPFAEVQGGPGPGPSGA